MISKTVKYEDFNGNQVEQTYHFHISKAELADLNFQEDGGSLAESLATVAQNETGIREVLDIFKRIVVAAVGRKSEDGSRFSKSDDARSELMDTDAYSELLFEMLDNPDFASRFIQGILPSSVQKEIKKSMGGRDIKELSREELLAKLAETNEKNKENAEANKAEEQNN